MELNSPINSSDVAVIGLAGRFPGCAGLEDFWANLVKGVEMISHFRPEELEYAQSARDPENAASYIRSRSVLEGVDQFDAAFFGIYPKEAEAMDPQHRLFLECAWEAIESAGYDAFAFPGLIGVYAGLSLNSYLLFNHASQPGFAERFAASYPVGSYETLFGNDKDFLTTRVAYKLNLRGPCVTMQSACSTSLVAIAQAYYSLLTYQCDMALAGGVSITFPQKRDYQYSPDGMVSKDGTCRAFDAEASGTVFGSGLGIVVLKRLADAIADGDQIRAVIKGAAVNNDGAGRIGYAAPGVGGQADVIAMAQASAGVAADTISYVEAHGTGTPLGDPIEVAALTEAFGRSTKAKGFCALGTAKTHVGHLDMAAGVTGFIKTVLQLEREMIPPLLHFKAPNPKIDFANSPFFPAARPIKWKRGAIPRRAGVSAFGVGGTNAHVVLEEAPPLASGSASRSRQLILLSARTPSALETAAQNLASHLERDTNLNLADVAFTLHKGRRGFAHRRMLVCRDSAEAVALLRTGQSKRVFSQDAGDGKPTVAFLFPGQGAQYANMGLGLYQSEPIYQQAVDRCAAILQVHLGLDLRSVLYPNLEGKKEADRLIGQTALTQPCIFTVEYALCELWASWGIKPAALLGHSIGEYVAAVLAGTLNLEDALGLIAARARLMQQLPGGSMLAVRLPADQAQDLLNDRIALAAINSPSLTVLSGPTPELEALAGQLRAKKVVSRFLDTSHAFHSPMMDTIMEPFAALVAKVPHQPPRIPWVSTCTGAEMTANDFADATYWGRQLRHPVRFAEALQWLMQDPTRVLLEVGPGQTLSALAQQHPQRHPAQIVLPSLQSSADEELDTTSMLNTLGRLWISGVAVNWDGFHANEKRRRVQLPTYPFERKRHWLEPVAAAPAMAARPAGTVDPDQVSIKTEAVVNADSKDALQNEIPCLSMTTTAQTTAQTQQNSASPKARFASELAGLFRDISGMDESQISATATFMELGFDSLFLTQASQTVQKKFGVKVSFRQMLDDLSSIDALASYLAGKLPGRFPPDAPAAKPSCSAAAAPLLPAPRSTQPAEFAPALAASTPVQGSLVDRVIAQQMALMQQQLELLRGGTTVGLQAAGGPAPVAPPSSTPPAPAIVRQPVSHAAGHEGNGKFSRFGPFKGIEIGPKGGLSPRQEKALAELTARYNRRTAGSKDYAQRHRSHFCDPRAAGNFRQQWKEMVYPIVCARSQGGKIWDIDGNEYVDVTLGFGANYFGHAPEFVVKAVEEQLHKGFEIGPQSPLAGEAAQMLCEMTGMERAAFCNTGSEGVMAAMRVARTVTARDKIVYFTGDYHGIFDEVLARAGMVNGQMGALPAAPGIPPLPNILVLEYGNPASLDVIRDHADEIAAVMVEPVQSRHPDLQPREFLHALRQLTTEKDMALIFDEVVTGFRAALGGAQEYFGVRADLAIYGKVVGGGLPIGVVAGTRRFMDALDGGAWRYGDDSYPEVGVTFFAGTFVRHPLAMAAAHATLKHLREAGPDLQRQTTEKTAKMVGRLNDYFVSQEVPLRLQSFSSVFFYDFHPDLTYGSLLFYYLRDRGVHIWEGRVGQTCTAHSEEDLNFVVDAFKASVEEMQQGGLLPASESGDHGASKAQTTVPETDVRRAPLTEAQREIWIAAQMGEDANCAYNESCSIHLHGPLDAPKLQQALETVIHRHDALRCRFDATGDYQEFAAPAPVALPVRDLSGFSSQERADQIAAIIKTDMATPFDLVQGPVFRAQLLKEADDQHQFVFTTHHAVCDGWSFGALFQELAQFYSALAEAKPCGVEPAMQFGEFARWSGEQQKSPEFRETEQFWMQKFEGTTIPVLDLPCDRPRPALKTYNGSLAVRRCDPQVFQSLKKASGQMGNTVFATLFSAFYVLLYRLSGQEDIVVGIPAAGQARVGSNDLVGHCLNFLPTRSKINGAQPFAEYAAKIKNEIFDVYDHQDYTYGTLITKLKLPRDASRLPLLSVMFNIDKRGMDKLKFSGLKAAVATNPKEYVNFDLFVNLVQGDNELDLECEFNTDLFDRETVMRWLGHFESLMRAIAANMRSPLDEMPLLGASERGVLLADWNQTTRHYPRDGMLHALFEDRAAKSPDAVAAIHDTQQITYAELNRRANHFARLLLEGGARPNSFVALCADRNLELVVGVLAVLKAGAAYVPLDPKYPQDRLAFYLEDSQAPLILTQRKLAASLPPHGAKVICLDDPVPDGAAPNPAAGVNPANAAYVIYTSGSTGKPKGVVIEHRNAVNFVQWALEAFTDAEMAGVLASTSICFDLSIFELFVTLSRGGKVILAENAFQLPRLAAKGQVTLINTVPSAMAELIREGALPSSIEVVNLAGEALPTGLVDQIYALKHVKKVNDLYGPTETTTYSTWTLRRSGEPPTIGRPIANTRIYIVDRKLQAAPIGVPGELLIGGAGVARGYLNRPELTAEKFMRDPFSAEAGAQVYRTGDLARYQADGNIEFLGRIDHQVKFRGFRIELGEIECLLREHPAVRESVAVVREDAPGQKRLVGYVVCKAAPGGAVPNGVATAHETSALPNALKAFLQPKLPDYMVPAVLVILDELPRTPNGKVDRKALPAPSADAAAAAAEFVAPRNGKEKALGEIWMQILGLKQVSVLDNFFELGGDSLLSFRVANRANQIGIHVTPRLILEHKTIAELVKAVESNEAGLAPNASAPGITRVSRAAHRRTIPLNG